MKAMRRALQGINLGGWLVVERWIPSVFEGVQGPAEIDIVRELGVEAARQRLTHHRNTFITEKDFRWIKQQGFDFVRLPVGYWLFETTDDFIDGEVYVRNAFTWAAKHNLRVILDFHGAQGSQNGKDHSGQTGVVGWFRRTHRQQVLKTLEYMARTYGQEPSLMGFEVINEPAARYCRVRRLMKYYDDAYRTIEPYLGNHVKIIVSDAFRPLHIAKKLAARPYHHKIVLDLHLYQVYSWRDRQRSFDRHVAIADETWWDVIDRVQAYVPVLVGEWSAALPPRAYADGRGSEAERVAAYYHAQKGTFDDGAWAHAYWTYKAPHCGVWSWRDSRRMLEE